MANILTRLFQGDKEQRSASQALLDKASQVELNLGGSYNRDIPLGQAELISTVYTCISILANTVSRLPISIYKKEGNKKEEYLDHPFYDTLKFNPQSFYSYQQWMMTLMSHRFFTGNAYAYISPSGGLQIIHPDLISDIKVIDDKDLWYYSQKLQEVFRYTDIIHFKGLSKTGIIGLNPIDSLRNEIQIQYKSEKSLNNFLSKNGNTTKYLQPSTTESKISNDKIQELVKQYTEKMSFNNNDSVIVVPPLYTIGELSLTTDAVKFLESNKYTTSQIAALFGVPEHLAGVGGTGGYGKYEEMSLAFVQTTIANIINELRSELEFKLLTIEERKQGVSIEFDLKQLSATDLTTHINALKIMKDSGALSPNEMRQEVNLPYIDSPAMNGYYQQMQYQNLLQPTSGSTGSNSVNYLITT